ncbi:MAG: hypothetical protein ACOCZP_03440, partial [Candidatus Hadarchaeota archaeon]
GGTTETAEIDYSPNASGIKTFETEGLSTSFEVYDLPSVKTEDSSNVDAEATTLNGRLSEIGMESEVEVYFEFRRKESSDWMKTDSEILSEETDFSIRIDNLSYDTEYEYRAVVFSDLDISRGKKSDFVTKGWGNLETLEATEVEAENMVLRADLSLNISEVDFRFRWREENAAKWNYTQKRTLEEGDVIEEVLGDLRYDSRYTYEAVVETYQDNYYGGSDVGVTDTWGNLSVGFVDDLRTDSALFFGEVERLNIDSVNVYFLYREENGAWVKTDSSIFKDPGVFEKSVSLSPGLDYEFKMITETYQDTYATESVEFSTPHFYKSYVENRDVDSAVLVGEVDKLGSYDNARLKFHYKEVEEEDWNETEVYRISEPKSIRKRVTELDPYTDYTFVALVDWGGVKEIGEEEQFTTRTLASVETVSVRDITYNSARVVGELLYLAGENATVWFEWKSAEEDHFNASEEFVMTDVGEFDSVINGLDWNTEYIVRARVDGVYETRQGEDIEFSTGLPWLWIMLFVILLGSLSAVIIFWRFYWKPH